MISVHSASHKGKAFKTNFHTRHISDTRGGCSTFSHFFQTVKKKRYSNYFVLNITGTNIFLESDKLAAAITNLHKLVIN